jgi:hypothetical protein
MRFAEPFKIAEHLDEAGKLNAERLMFLELTQGQSSFFFGRKRAGLKSLCSLPLGKLHRFVSAHQYDRGSNQISPVDRW